MEFNFKNYNPRNLTANINKEKIITIVSDKSFQKFFCFLFVVFNFFYFFFIAPPFSFPAGAVVEIKTGETLKEISKDLKDKKVIKSRLWFEIAVRISNGEKGAMSGDYYFEKPKNVFAVAYKITKADYGLFPIRTTIPEGLTIEEIANVLEKDFDKFDSEEFKSQAYEKELEGYLFPDTYFFLPNITSNNVIRIMNKNFRDKIATIQDKIDASEKSLKEIIIMASILEEEARTLKSKKIISGILWSRIDIGMPLQVDAVFPYIIGKNTYQLSLEDLKTESEYNTYTNRDLPPGAITNPGLESIIAATEPIETDYLYYLSDRQGNMYYAVSFEEHKKNKELYVY